MSGTLKHSLSSLFVAIALTAVLAVCATAADSQRSGIFSGRSNHVTSGGVTLAKTGNSVTLTLHGDFRLDGAPDPWIGFGANGRYIKSTRFTKLRRLSGKQVYRVPASIDISSVGEVYIWCHRFSSPLGVAKLR